MTRRTRFRRAEEEAVSPIVAEILLVAIAIILASILYFVTVGLISQTESGALVTLVTTPSVDGNNYTIEIVAVTDTFFISDARILIKNTDGDLYFSGPLSLMNNTWLNNTRYNDVNMDGAISPADYFQFKRGVGYFLDGWIIEIYHLNSQTLAGRATLP